MIIEMKQVDINIERYLFDKGWRKDSDNKWYRLDKGNDLVFQESLAFHYQMKSDAFLRLPLYKKILIRLFRI